MSVAGTVWPCCVTLSHVVADEEVDILMVMGWGVLQFVGVFIILYQCVFIIKSNMALCVCKCVVHLFFWGGGGMF
jgi:hypothetical protein